MQVSKKVRSGIATAIMFIASFSFYFECVVLEKTKLYSAYIDLNELDGGCVFITNRLITTKPQLDIVCSWLRELLAEPRWIVELTASTGTPASLTVPDWIIRIEGKST